MSDYLNNAPDRYAHHITSETYEMERGATGDGLSSTTSTEQLLGDTSEIEAPKMTETSVVKGMARHTLGLLLLLAVVFLWTASSFLGSSIFANDEYAKPFFLTYLDSSAFIVAMVPTLVRSAWRLRQEGEFSERMQQARLKYRSIGLLGLLKEQDDYHRQPRPEDEDEEQESFLHSNDTESDLNVFPSTTHRKVPTRKRTHLSLLPTANLAFRFSFLWFSANYFAFACLQHTTVASTTILTSTSSIWTLLIGAFTRTERFTLRKLLGVLASLAGIIIISRADLLTPSPDTTTITNTTTSSPNPPTLTVRAPSSFPSKPPSELILGDAMALVSAIIYGFYTITLKRTTLSCAPLSLNMPLFFGLVGLFNTLVLWPFFPIFHLCGYERFAMPPNSRIWGILGVNAVGALLSDICWAYSMVLTSPLVVTVGLSLTIPLSLVGEVWLQGRVEGWVYWIGAAVVVGSFVFVDREELGEEKTGGEAGGEDVGRIRESDGPGAAGR